MKRIILTLGLVVTTLVTFSQTWGYPQKNQPIQFNNNVVFSDTIAFDTASQYNAIYSGIMTTDTTSDGRWYFRMTSLNVATDSSYIGTIAADSTKWVDVGVGSSDITTKSGITSVNIGTNSAISGIDLQIDGVVKNGVAVLDLASSGRLTLSNNVISLTGSGTDSLTEVVGAQAGVILTFYNAGANSVYLSPSSFAGNPQGQTLRTASGNPITLGQYDVVKILCISDLVFYQISAVQDNQ